jgi:hypothetical protein
VRLICATAPRKICVGSRFACQCSVTIRPFLSPFLEGQQNRTPRGSLRPDLLQHLVEILMPTTRRPRRTTISAMAVPVTLPVLARKTRKSQLGTFDSARSAFTTEFELRVRQLKLTPETYASSRELAHLV